MRNMAILANAADRDGVRIEAAEEARVLLIAGRPLGEPIAQYGPFVMNTEQEIYQAVADYRAGRLGGLIGPGSCPDAGIGPPEGDEGLRAARWERACPRPRRSASASRQLSWPASRSAATCLRIGARAPGPSPASIDADQRGVVAPPRARRAARRAAARHLPRRGRRRSPRPSTYTFISGQRRGLA